MTSLVRALGAVERLFYRYAQRNPLHHSIVAEFDIVVGADRLRAALDAVQRRHPLLSVHVEDRPTTRLGFYRADTVAPIELTVHSREDATWQSDAADELRHPFDRSTAPLMRAVLIQGPSSSTVILTFDHTVADGISAVLIVKDIVASLNGDALVALPVPPTQEEMIRLTLASVEQGALSELSSRDPRMDEPGAIRPFDSSTPYISTISMDHAESTRLVERCRTERTTVHSALVTAASRVHSTQRGGEFVRVVSPMNFRELIGAGGDCVDYFIPTSTGLVPLDGSPFWTQARMIGHQLALARSARGIATASSATQQAISVDAEAETTEQFLVGGMAFELLISNLGVQDLDNVGPLRPTALWGPVLLNQVEGEHVIGVVTYQGQLRMVLTAYSPMDTFLDDLRRTLVAAS